MLRPSSQQSSSDVNSPKTRLLTTQVLEPQGRSTVSTVSTVEIEHENTSGGFKINGRRLLTVDRRRRGGGQPA
jgi:hypothetical protein